MVRTDKPLDNPINWSFRVGRLFDIDIHVHIAFVICAVVMIWMEMPKQGETWNRSVGMLLIDVLGMYTMLFFIVLLHEFGHCFGARRVGGEADEILIWPLGGLAYANPPHNAKAHMITTVAGPLVNVILCMICTAVLVVWTGDLGAVPWNPLHPTVPVSDTVWLTATTSQVWLMRFFGISYFILLINLLPIFPFDGGRIVQAWLWPKKGYVTSMEIATGTGMVGAILVGLVGLFTEQSWILLMIAVFGYMTCWQNRRMLKEQGDIAGGEFGYDFSQGYKSFDRPEGREKKPGYLERRRIRQAALKAVAEQKEREAHEKRVEAILRKISDTGMDSLTPKERCVLEEETARKRTSPKE